MHPSSTRQPNYLHDNAALFNCINTHRAEFESHIGATYSRCERDYDEMTYVRYCKSFARKFYFNIDSMIEFIRRIEENKDDVELSALTSSIFYETVNDDLLVKLVDKICDKLGKGATAELLAQQLSVHIINNSRVPTRFIIQCF